MALAIGGWVRFMTGVDHAGAPIDGIKDPNGGTELPRLAALAVGAPSSETVAPLLEAYFGHEVAEHAVVVRAVTEALQVRPTRRRTRRASQRLVARSTPRPRAALSFSRGNVRSPRAGDQPRRDGRGPREVRRPVRRAAAHVWRSAGARARGRRDFLRQRGADCMRGARRRAKTHASRSLDRPHCV